MALLQIAEPGQSVEPHRHRLAVGIDLGTTNSLVATVRNCSMPGASTKSYGMFSMYSTSRMPRPMNRLTDTTVLRASID